MPTDSPWRRSAPCCSDTRPISKVCSGGCLSPQPSDTTAPSTRFACCDRTWRASKNISIRPRPICSRIRRSTKCCRKAPRRTSARSSPSCRRRAMPPCARSSPPICAADGAMARRWPYRPTCLPHICMTRNSTMITPPAALTGPISAAAIRAAGRSCNGWRTTAGGWSGAAYPMDRPMIRRRPATATSRNGACSATSSAPASARSSRRWPATG